MKDVFRLADEKHNTVTVADMRRGEKGRRRMRRHVGRTLPSACAKRLACPSNQSYLLLPALLVLM